MKRMICVAVMVLVSGSAFFLFAQQGPNPAGTIINHYSARNFAVGTIPVADLDIIVQAGVRSPSASNRQPWHLTIVRNLDLAKKIVPQSVEGNVLIVISAAGDSKTNTREIIDCALATQSIYLAAQALGYGSRIYTGPIDNLNRTLKGELGLPAGHSAVALVRVGRVEGRVDAVSAASSRNAANTMVTNK
jgi:nitroreductase